MIDIIVNPSLSKEKLEGFLKMIEGSSAFIRMDIDERRSYKDGIPKAHYKFIFNSNFAFRNQNGNVVSNPEREILLDVLFEDNHYETLISMPIRTEWLVQKDEPIFVTTPDINSITGDKLTAFAPNTTGILYGTGKEKEILKQLFDVGCLFDLLTNLETFKKSFLKYAEGEIAYRPERKIASFEVVLQDIIDTSLLIARNDVLKSDVDKAKFSEIKLGINQFSHFVYVGKFGILEALVASAKAAYLAAIIITDYKGELQKFSPSIPLVEYMVTYPEYNFLNKRLKFVASGKALFYWFQTIRLLEHGFTINDGNRLA